MDVNNIGNYSADLARFIQQANRHATDNGVGDATVVRADRECIGTRDDYGTTFGFSRLTLSDAPGDKVGGFAAIFRSRADKAANNATRELFKSAVAGMFGGEDRIPESVRDAMKMNDYGKGRPLTARRILAVREAIDKASRAECDQFSSAIQVRVGREGLVDPERLLDALSDEKRIETSTHLDELAKCAQQYKRETRCSNEEAVEALFTISRTASEKGQRLSLGDLSELAQCAQQYRREMECSHEEAVEALFAIPAKADEIKADESFVKLKFEGCVPKNATAHERTQFVDRAARYAALFHVAKACSYNTAISFAALTGGMGPIATALGKNGEPRFMENVANFRYGLRLMDAFEALSKDVWKGRKSGQYDMAFEKKNWNKTRDYLFNEIARDVTNLAVLAGKAERDPDMAFSPYIDKVRERLNGDAGSNPQPVDLSSRVEDDD